MKSFKRVLATLIVALGCVTVQAAENLITNQELDNTKKFYFSEASKYLDALQKFATTEHSRIPDKIYAIQFTIKNQLAQLVTGVKELEATEYYTDIMKKYKDTLNPLVEAVKKHLETKSLTKTLLGGAANFNYAFREKLINLTDDQKQTIVTIYALLLAKFLLLTPEEQIEKSDVYLNTLTQKLANVIKDPNIETAFLETLAEDENSFYSYLVQRQQEKNAKQQQEAKMKAEKQATQQEIETLTHCSLCLATTANTFDIK